MVNIFKYLFDNENRDYYPIFITDLKYSINEYLFHLRNLKLKDN